MYKSKQAVIDIIIIENILVLDFSFFRDLKKPITAITIAITAKQPIIEEIM